MPRAFLIKKHQPGIKKPDNNNEKITNEAGLTEQLPPVLVQQTQATVAGGHAEMDTERRSYTSSPPLIPYTGNYTCYISNFKLDLF